MKNKKIVIPIDILEHRVTIVFCKSIQEYINKRPKFFPKTDLSRFAAICFSNPMEYTCVIPNDSPVSIVAHEVSHAVDNVMENRGLEDGEMRAIIFEYIIKQIYG